MKRSLGNFFDTSGSSMMSRRWNRQPMRVTFLIMIAVAIRAGTLMHTKSQSLKFTPSILTVPDKKPGAPGQLMDEHRAILSRLVKA
jgi:hypothetical protein